MNMDYIEFNDFIANVKAGTWVEHELEDFIEHHNTRTQLDALHRKIIKSMCDIMAEEMTQTGGAGSRNPLELGRLENAMHILEGYIKKGRTRTLPKELDTEEARVYLERAIEHGWMTEDYEWKLTHMACACFAVEMNRVLWGVGHNDKIDDPGKRLKYAPFTKLFGLKSDQLSKWHDNVTKAGGCKEFEERRTEVFHDKQE